VKLASEVIAGWVLAAETRDVWAPCGIDGLRQEGGLRGSEAQLQAQGRVMICRENSWIRRCELWGVGDFIGVHRVDAG
jgi:hypothetical protein